MVAELKTPEFIAESEPGEVGDPREGYGSTRPRRSRQSVPDRLPPHDVSAEQGLLGCIILDQSQIPEVASKGEGLFYDLRHQAIFDAAKEIHDAGSGVDVITLCAKIKQRKQTDFETMGISYVAELPDATPSAANLPYYLEILVDHSVRRRVIQLAAAAMSAAYAGEIDALTLLDDAEKGLSEISKTIVGDKEAKIGPLVDKAVEALERQYTNGDKIEGIATGFDDLDRMTNGLKGGEMIVIAARPAMGKTSLAMNIAEYVSTDSDVPVGVFSLEMTDESLIRRMLCSRAEINERAFREKTVTEKDFKRLGASAMKLKRSNLHIDDSSGLSIMQLRARARRMSRQHAIQLLVIDYLQLLQACTGRKEINRQQEIANISNGVKALAKELNIPVIVLSQLNRELEKDKNRKPRLSDLRESGAIEQDADVIGMLYCPEENPENKEILPVNMLIAKQRNGPTGDVPFTFFKGITRFKPRSKFD